MAEVYRARVRTGPRAGWPVAVKWLPAERAQNPEYVDLFASEADLSKFLDHPNIVKVLEVGIQDGIYFMVMELVDGRDLGQIIRRCKQRGIPLPLDFAVYLAKVILDALGYAHGAKNPAGVPLEIVHADVSPSNVFISRTGEIKLGDFGIARAAVAAQQPELLGKPYYLSPEVLDGQMTRAADLWAANVILYELLTLERPFTGKTPEEVFAAIRERRHRYLHAVRPEVPPALEIISDRGFAVDPKLRFQTAEAFAAALAPLYDENVGTPLAIAAVVRGLFGTEG
jgi:serine/threonine-protein kinase